MNPKQILHTTIDKIQGAYAPATIRAYKSNFINFISFCEEIRRPSLPADPEDVAQYVYTLSCSHFKSASIRLAVAAISTIHKLNKLSDPTQSPEVKIELRRMHRKLGRASGQAHGVTIHTLKHMLDAANTDHLRDIRDRALLQLAYDSLCRRSELISLQVSDIVISNTDSNTLKIRLRKSKTDQESIGRWLHVSETGQKALKLWLERSGIKDGAIFRGVTNNGKISQSLSCGQINRIYKRLAVSANLDQALIGRISGHSMRVGAAQDLLLSGASLPILMNRGRWSKPDTVMRYIESVGMPIE
jgi:site-specific recombinase XerD